jgi:hypothetical protein
VVSATASQVYDLVADLPRMGEWSPECAAVEWEDAHAGPVVGARFVGHSRTGPRKLIRRSRRGRVLVADPGHEFAFATEEGGREGVVWRYRFEPVDGGTCVTESYEVTWLPPGLGSSMSPPTGTATCSAICVTRPPKRLTCDDHRVVRSRVGR